MKILMRRRKELLVTRQQRQKRIDDGDKTGFLSRNKRYSGGRLDNCATSRMILQDRRVEITGPVGRKMVINALNSGAKIFMACFEDATSPTWANMIGRSNQYEDACTATIEFTQHSNGKTYKLNDETAVLMIRPRGLHLLEKNVCD